MLPGYGPRGMRVWEVEGGMVAIMPAVIDVIHQGCRMSVVEASPRF